MRIITDLDDAIDYLNFLFEGDSTAPTAGEEDYEVWTGLINVGINLWENEEEIKWNELFVKLADAATGDKTTVAGDNSYAVPDDFRFPASGYVWLGSGTNKTAYKVIKQENIQLYENDRGNWCYFLMDTTPTLEFNPNLTIPASQTISYLYYKYASKVSSGSDTFEMKDPMFAVYYTLSELRKDEGDTSSLTIATQKLESMKTNNHTSNWNQEDSLMSSNTSDGFGI